MEYLITALEVTMALFAVIGIYSLARLISQKLFGSKQLILSVEIRTKEDLAIADALIMEGLGQFLLTPSERVIILTDSVLAKDASLQMTAARFGIRILVT